jgi:hypothetical protein
LEVGHCVLWNVPSKQMNVPIYQAQLPHGRDNKAESDETHIAQEN